MRDLRNGYGSRGYGWLATFGGALLLLAFGFGVGLLTGSLFEEPDLVARQLSGEARELPLPPPEPAAAEPPPAAVPGAEPAPAASPEPEAAEFDGGQEEAAAPSAPPPAKAAPEPAPRAAPERTELTTPPSAERAAAAPPRPAVAPAREAERADPELAREEPPSVSSRGPGGFAVQVGAFSDRAGAQRLVGSLRGDRFAAYVVEGAPGEGARFRVRVGPYATRDEASAQAGRLKERRKLPTWVIREGGP